MSKTAKRCNCTMEQIAPQQWRKPADGYIEPDPNCKQCNGTGSYKITLVMGEGATKTYVGICPICGYRNGILFRYPDMEDVFNEIMSSERRPKCKNSDCLSEFCEWVDSEDVQEES